MIALFVLADETIQFWSVAKELFGVILFLLIVGILAGIATTYAYNRPPEQQRRRERRWKRHGGYE